jgi:hypothetical protein
MVRTEQLAYTIHPNKRGLFSVLRNGHLAHSSCKSAEGAQDYIERDVEGQRLFFRHLKTQSTLLDVSVRSSAAVLE